MSKNFIHFVLRVMLISLPVACWAQQPQGVNVPPPPAPGGPRSEPPAAVLGIRPPGPEPTAAQEEREFFAPDPRRMMSDYSWTYSEVPKPKPIRVHDIITILVDEKAEMTQNSRYNRTKNVTVKAELKEFMRINENGNLGNAAENQPTIDGNLNGRAQQTGQLIEQEGVRYHIAAMVVSIRPNGNLILEARKDHRTNEDRTIYRLTGEIAADKVAADRTARSEDMYNIQTEKDQKGKVYDSTKRGWGSVLWDIFFPF